MNTPAAPSFFDAYNSTAAGVHVQIATSGPKFTIACICAQCASAKRPNFAFNAADANLARAISFALDSYGAHIRKFHK